MTTPTRTALLDAACQLFYQNGIHGTSIDSILEQAGVARQSLYQHFTSKDGLIAEFLKLRDERWRAAMRERMARASTPRAQLLAAFDYLAEWFAEPNFRGCAFINTAVEYSDARHPYHLAAAEHKRLMAEDLHLICQQASLRDTPEVAAQLALLMEGAIVTEFIAPGSHAAERARRMAATLLQLHSLPSQETTR